jgi:hypothetical protein
MSLAAIAVEPTPAEESEVAEQPPGRPCVRCGGDSPAVLVAREILCGGCFLDATMTDSYAGGGLSASRRAIELEVRLLRAVNAVERLEALLRYNALSSRRRGRKRR